MTMAACHNNLDDTEKYSLVHPTPTQGGREAESWVAAFFTVTPHRDPKLHRLQLLNSGGGGWGGASPRPATEEALLALSEPELFLYGGFSSFNSNPESPPLTSATHHRAARRGS
jgi:hypothetical protein